MVVVVALFGFGFGAGTGRVGGQGAIESPIPTNNTQTPTSNIQSKCNTDLEQRNKASGGNNE